MLYLVYRGDAPLKRNTIYTHTHAHGLIDQENITTNFP